MPCFNEKVLKANPFGVPVVKTAYWKWLAERDNYTCNRLADLHRYLDSIGFVMGVDVLDGRIIQSLGYIHSHFFHIEVRRND